MAFKVQVGPAQIAIHQGQAILLTAHDGQISWPSNRGLYFRDTRVISAWAMPDWLPDVTLTDLRLGRQRFNIRFWRDGKDTVFKVLIGKSDLVERKTLLASCCRN